VIDRIELVANTHERPLHMLPIDTVDKEGLYCMSNDLMRFSVAMPEELLMQFDELVARRGIAKNRSEVVRDLVRDALVEDECDTPGKEVVGTLTIVFSHHSNDLVEKLDTIQHGYYEMIISTMHIHLDEENCLEVIAMRGDTGTVQEISDRILGTKGVKHGRLVLTTTGKFI
jgi:CopG family nickel-responsive transcriptional regulator